MVCEAVECGMQGAGRVSVLLLLCLGDEALATSPAVLGILIE